MIFFDVTLDPKCQPSKPIKQNFQLNIMYLSRLFSQSINIIHTNIDNYWRPFTSLCKFQNKIAYILKDSHVWALVSLFHSNTLVM